MATEQEKVEGKLRVLIEEIRVAAAEAEAFLNREPEESTE